MAGRIRIAMVPGGVSARPTEEQQVTQQAAASAANIGRSASRGGGGSGAAAASGSAMADRLLPRIPMGLWLAGMAFIGVAMAASGALVLKHFTGVALPGCHAGSACDKLDQTVFGRILFPKGLAESLGFAKWPISSLGFAFFAGIAGAWVTGFRWIAPGMKWLIRFGALFSLVYVGVIVVLQELCKYCLATHAANFSLLVCMEIGLMMSKRSGLEVRAAGAAGAKSRRAGLVSLLAFAIAFVGATGVLGMKERGLAVAAEAQRAESERLILQKEQEKAAAIAAAAAQKAAQPQDYDFGPNGFTGRYRMGPEKAQVRIVLYGAYTCQFCKRMEGEALALQAANPTTVSFSFKHFPMCWICNKHTKKEDTEEVHYNACWAARCAEACAIVAGANAELEGKDRWTAANEAFWKAHNWLYSIDGKFDDASLMSGLKAQGFDPDKVTAIMDKPAADKGVVADIEEGHTLGLFQTPMIFLNGTELKGWQTPGALQRTVAAMLAKQPPLPFVNAKDGMDKPDLGCDKAVADWREETDKVFMADTTLRAIGDPNAPVKVVMFGDFQEENTAKADARIRAMIFGPGGTAKTAADGKPIYYQFRHFPGDQTCNTKLRKTFFPQGCLASKSAEAAGLMGGDAAYWKMHDWLMTHQSGFGYDAARKAAGTIGLDADVFVTSLNKPEVAKAIQNDIEAAEAIGVGQIPAIYIQGKFVKTWTREGCTILEQIVAESAQGDKKPAKK